MQVISNRALLVLAAAFGAVVLAVFVVKPALDGDDDGKATKPAAVKPAPPVAPAVTEQRTTPAPAPESASTSAAPLIAVLPEAKRAFTRRTSPATQLLKVTLDGREGHIRFAYRKGQTSDGLGLVYRPAGGFTRYDVRINAGPQGFDVFRLTPFSPAIGATVLRRIRAQEKGFDPTVVVLAPVLAEHRLYWEMTDGRTTWRALGDGAGDIRRTR